MFIPGIWVAFVLQGLAALFFAGIGWNRLANVEGIVGELKTSLANRQQDISRLAVIENKMESIEKHLEKISVKLESSLTYIPPAKK